MEVKKINDFNVMCEAQCEMAKDLVAWIEKLQATYTEHPECIADMVKGYLKNFIETWGKKEVENENN